MNRERADHILAQVAVNYGVTKAEVVREIEEAIAAATANPSPEVRRLWDQLFGAAHIPSAAEFITCLAGKLREQ